MPLGRFLKAFDTIPHSTLLDKLESQGCPQYVINWLASYLTDRTQSLATSGGLSPPLPITRSIIQGSGIGPTSFIAYIADLKPLSSTNIYSKYADDLTILCPELSPVTISDELEHVQSWAETNGLLINKSKTKEIVFHRPSVTAGTSLFHRHLMASNRLTVLGCSEYYSLTHSHLHHILMQYCLQLVSDCTS